MKTVICTQHCSPEVLQIQEVVRLTAKKRFPEKKELEHIS
jgi:hypothetical protein